MSENNSDVIEAYDDVSNDTSYVVIVAIKIFPSVTNELSQYYLLYDFAFILVAIRVILFIYFDSDCSLIFF